MGKIAERIFMITLIGTLLGFGVKNINAATKSTQYKMVWSDEFNGTKLNLKNWTYDIEMVAQISAGETMNWSIIQTGKIM